MQGKFTYESYPLNSLSEIWTLIDTIRIDTVLHRNEQWATRRNFFPNTRMTPERSFRQIFDPRVSITTRSQLDRVNVKEYPVFFFYPRISQCSRFNKRKCIEREEKKTKENDGEKTGANFRRNRLHFLRAIGQ